MKRLVLIIGVFCIIHSCYLSGMETSSAYSYKQLLFDMLKAAVNRCFLFVQEDLKEELEVSRLQRLREEICAVEQVLTFNYESERGLIKQLEHHRQMYCADEYIDLDRILFQVNLKTVFIQVASKPTKFLKYCYYQRYHDSKEGTSLRYISEFQELMQECRALQVHGCSAIGAAILAKDVSQDYKRSFIEELITVCDMEPTIKDRMFARVLLYDAIQNTTPYKDTILLCLNISSPHFDGIIPYDIKLTIMYYLVLLLHKEYGFLSFE